MPYITPTLTEERQNTLADLDASFSNENGRLRFSLAGVLAEALSAGINGNYAYLDWIALQATPFTSSDEYLEAWAALKNITRKAASQASGTVTFLATPGSVIPAGTSIYRGDGVTYTTLSNANFNAGSISPTIMADIGGAIGNCAAGTSFYISSPINGINTSGVSTNDFLGGADIETDDLLRSRMLQAYSEPSGGGSTDDFVKWALDVNGVTRAWCLRGLGIISVYIMLDIANQTTGGYPIGNGGVSNYETRITPKATNDLARAADQIFTENFNILPVLWYGPQPNIVNFTILGLSQAQIYVQDAILQSIKTVFLNLGDPLGGTIDLSYIEGAIGAVNGSAGFIITAVSCNNGTILPNGNGNIQSNIGFIPVLGQVTWA